MRFSVYLKSQSLTEQPAHETSRALAVKAVDAGLALKCGQNAIHLRTIEAWSTVKAKFRPVNGKLPSQSLLPPLEHYLPYNYPLPYSLLKNYQARP